MLLQIPESVQTTDGVQEAGIVKDDDKTKEQLVSALVEIRQRVAELETLETDRKQLEIGLRERIRELDCLYKIGEIAEKPDITMEELCQETVGILPLFWHYPEITCARITIGDNEFKTKNHRDTEWEQVSDIRVYGEIVGKVEITYLEEMLESDKGPFLKEERALVDAVGEWLGRITEHKQAEEKIKHLTLVLRAIRNVNQLITKEKDRDRLLKGACDNLTETRGYYNVWIALLDESGKLAAHAESGLGKSFLPVVERLKCGQMTTCGQRALKQTEAVVTEDPASTCTDCPLSSSYADRSAATARLEYEGKVYGFLSVSTSREMATDVEGLGLFHEVAEDIAFALYNMELEEKRKRTEEALRESEEQYRQLFETMTSGVAVYEAVDNGDNFVFRDFNQAGVNIEKVKREDVIGRRVTEAFPGVREFGLFEALQRVWRTDKSEYFPEAFYRDERDPGTWRENWVYKLPSGEIVTVYNDINKRKQQEEVLWESEQRYRTLVENINDIVFTLDRDGNFTYLSPRFKMLTGYLPQDLSGHSFVEILAPDYIESTINRFARGLFGTIISLYEVELLLKDGKRLPVELNVSPLLDAEGQAIGRLGVARDITERKQAEEKAREVEALRELDQLRSGLLSNVSHELRTPLTSIKGFASTLLRTDVKWSEENQRDFITTIDREADRLTSLISDLLDISRVDAGGLKLDKQDCYITEVLDSINDALAHLTKNHQLQIQVARELPSLFVDRRRIGQVLTNLVENAAKYSQEGTGITIEAQLKGDEILISVTDRGEGIAPESLEMVFDRFYQAESIVTGRKSGTGLGLSICRGIVEAHGGEIWVESKLGEVSRFSFSLPVGKRE